MAREYRLDIGTRKVSPVLRVSFFISSRSISVSVDGIVEVMRMRANSSMLRR